MNLPAKKSGFTLTELLVVIGIIGFLSAIAVPAYGVIRTGVALQNTAQELENALRGAQNRSIASQDNKASGVEVTASGYKLYYFDTSGTPEEPPLQEFTFTPGLTATVTPPGPIEFERLTGQPSTAVTITLSVGGTSKTVTVDAVGRVTVE